MNLWRRIRQLSLKQLLQLGALLLKNPLLIAPTLKASKRTMETCDLLFGKLHHSNKKENAFRHALWNFEICRNCMKIIKNDGKTVNWALKITNLYEKVTKNHPLDEAMDMHNNEVGRNLFFRKKLTKSNEIEQILVEMMQKAIKISKIQQLQEAEEQLVYISE